ncbi:MAG TPA: NAD(P)-dependent oxidoreductase, partial [Planctomycetaceae bacterium]|nr:NAD(P)-dependent oxidoreductase [Planctomycetaceae bacterium]
LVLLGVGGKMGPTMARMAKRAVDATGKMKRVIGVSRFSDQSIRDQLESSGVETIACDLLDPNAVNQLPLAENVVYLAGFKFGASSDPGRLWAMNCLAPAWISRKYSGSRIVALSTGNVYRPVSADSGGSRELDLPEPRGEYAIAALGREHIFQYFSETAGTSLALLRLNYAHDLRYGVFVDVAQDLMDEKSVDISTGHVNIIWLADANAMTLRALEQCRAPVQIINVTGPETLSVRVVAEQLADVLGVKAQYTGTEEATALLSNATVGHQLLGLPAVSADQVIRWTADWIGNRRPLLNKPTKFQVRDGKY